MKDSVYKNLSKKRWKDLMEKYDGYSIQEIIYSFCRLAGIKAGDLLSLSNEEVFNLIEKVDKDERE